MKLTNTQSVLLGAGALYALSMLGNKIASKIIPGTPSLLQTNWSFHAVNFTFEMPVENQTPVSATLDGFQGQVMYGEYVVAPIIINGPITLQANAVTPIVFDVPVVYASLAEEILDLFTDTANQGFVLSALVLKGMLQAAGLNIPINQQIRLV